MSDVLLVDFGASRVKCALWSTDRRALLEEAEVPAPAPTFGPHGEVEIAPEDYWTALENTAGQLVRRHKTVDALWLCTEMHGIIVADTAGTPITPYISWRDSRGTLKDIDGQSTLDRLAKHDGALMKLSGMSLRAGLPLVTLEHLVRKGAVPGRLRLFTLADWILWRGGERTPAIHASLAAGTALYDVGREDWSPTLLELAGLAGRQVHLAKLALLGEAIGGIRLAGGKIRVFGGVGDLQAAVFGAGFPRRANLAVNLGTGSQVVRAGNETSAEIERRPGADGRVFSAITHIPSGRALNVFAGFVDGCSQLGGGKPLFWQHFSKLTEKEVLEAPLKVDLNVFSAGWKYQSGGSLSLIHEGRFGPDELIASIAKGWLEQYAKAMDRLDPARAETHFLVAGGLSRRARFVTPVLGTFSGRTPISVESATGEETLDGLAAMAEGFGHDC